jgi:hypothetical protein
LAIYVFCFASYCLLNLQRQIQDLQYKLSFLGRYSKLCQFVFPDGEIVYPLKDEEIKCPKCGQTIK